MINTFRNSTLSLKHQKNIIFKKIVEINDCYVFMKYSMNYVIVNAENEQNISSFVSMKIQYLIWRRVNWISCIFSVNCTFIINWFVNENKLFWISVNETINSIDSKTNVSFFDHSNFFMFQFKRCKFLNFVISSIKTSNSSNKNQINSFKYVVDLTFKKFNQIFWCININMIELFDIFNSNSNFVIISYLCQYVFILLIWRKLI